MAVKLNKDVQQVVKLAGVMGFTWDGGLTGSGHLKLRHRNGGMVFIPATPGKYSWKKNAESDLKRVARGARGTVSRTLGQFFTAVFLLVEGWPEIFTT